MRVPGVAQQPVDPVQCLFGALRRLPARRSRHDRPGWSVGGRPLRVVAFLFDASGGRAIYLHNPLQRYVRDVHAMRAHAINNPDKAAQVFCHSELHPGTPPPDLFL